MKTLEMRNVSVVRDGSRILDSVSLDLEEGESAAVLGRNGSGKTTLMKLIRGDVSPYYDEDDPAVMRIFGEENPNIFDLRNRIGVISMDLQLLFRGDTTVREMIASGFFGSLDVFRNMSVDEGMEKKVFSAAYAMGIDDILDRRVEGLSLGESRRALIARALVTNPETLVLDEPMTGLDVVMASKFRRMFDMLIGSRISIVMITHDLADIPEKVDRIVMIRDGKVFADGRKSDLLTSKMMTELYGEPIKVESDRGVYRMHIADA
ncbi:MAG: ATP-binding cassette domain-containing protein [Candidatus Methanoplasma sp.]|jgi:iron complex transport system ATP-binding protein|nr:ATP-binding cassette domain-containing protein [Candidatus Methanoplasma sp.]